MAQPDARSTHIQAIGSIMGHNPKLQCQRDYDEDALANKLTIWIDGLTRSWWKLLLVAIANFASFRVLFWLEDQFETLTGKVVFDTQNDLSAPVLRSELPLYSGDALEAYWRFAAFDFVFPLVASFFLAVLWALLLRLNPAPWMARIKAWPLPLFALAITIFDYLENVGLLITLGFAPNPPDWPITMALLFKRLKLFGLGFGGAVTALLVLSLLVGLVQAFWQRSRNLPKA